MTEQQSIKLSLSQADLLSRLFFRGNYLNQKNKAVVSLAKMKLIETVVRPGASDKIGDYWVITEAGKALLNR
jgi:hypothetical protein